MLNKQQIIEALRKWINQRPGLEFGNYGDWSAYRSELRSIARDRKEALELLRAVEWRDGITAEDIIDAARSAYSGRLSIECQNGGFVAPGKRESAVRIEYCTGQYWPTEYRRAVCSVLASALWNHTREHCMPEPVYKQYGDVDHRPMQTVALYKGKRAGDWLREHFRREFGRSIASRWFN